MEQREVQPHRQPARTGRRQSTQIGWYGYRPGSGKYVCFSDGCAIAGSAEQLRLLVQRFGRTSYRDSLCQSMSYEELRAGLAFGGAYALDSTALARFLPLARQDGLDLVVHSRLLERHGGDPTAGEPCRALLHHVWVRRLAFNGRLDRLLRRLPRVDVPPVVRGVA